MLEDRAYLAFVRELVRKLPRLRQEAGDAWPEIADRIAQQFKAIAEADGPDTANRLSEGLYYALMQTPVAGQVDSIWRRSWTERTYSSSAPQKPRERAPVARRAPDGPRRQRGWPGMRDTLREASLGLLISSTWSQGVGRKVSLPDAPPVDAAVPPSAPPDRDETFHYVLKGEKVRGKRILVSSKADLVFQFSVPGEQVVAQVSAAPLTKARIEGLEMTIIARGDDRIAMLGVPVGLARFKDGRMIEDVVFPIEAGAEPGPASIQLDYYVRSQRVHQSEISLDVVKTLSARNAGVTVLGSFVPDDALAVPVRGDAPLPRTICLSIGLQSGKLSITAVGQVDGVRTWSEMYCSNLDRTDIDNLLTQAKAALMPMYANADAWGEIGGAPAAGATEAERCKALVDALESVALAGSILYDGLHEDQEIAKLLDYIDTQVPEKSVLTIGTAEVFLPWEILYSSSRPQNPTDEEKAADPVNRDLFWGARFAIETDLGGQWPTLPALRARHVEQGPRVSINVDPEITAAGAAGFDARAVHRQWADDLKERKALEGMQDSCATIRPQLVAGASEASLIYVFCHGAPANVAAGMPAELYLHGEACKVAPRDFKPAKNFQNAPIIFLNSCYAGTSSPYVTNQFLRRFRELGALGTIATSFEVPTVFAASFAGAVVDAYMQREGSLAEEMRSLRKCYLDAMNPVPLLYTLQCALYQPFPKRGEQHV